MRWRALGQRRLVFDVCGGSWITMWDGEQRSRNTHEDSHTQPMHPVTFSSACWGFSAYHMVYWAKIPTHWGWGHKFHCWSIYSLTLACVWPVRPLLNIMVTLTLCTKKTRDKTQKNITYKPKYSTCWNTQSQRMWQCDALWVKSVFFSFSFIS